MRKTSRFPSAIEAQVASIRHSEALIDLLSALGATSTSTLLFVAGGT
jgi:hypothetical protein